MCPRLYMLEFFGDLEKFYFGNRPLSLKCKKSSVLRSQNIFSYLILRYYRDLVMCLFFFFYLPCHFPAMLCRFCNFQYFARWILNFIYAVRKYFAAVDVCGECNLRTKHLLNDCTHLQGSEPRSKWPFSAHILNWNIFKTFGSTETGIPKHGACRVKFSIS